MSLAGAESATFESSVILEGSKTALFVLQLTR